MMDWINAILTLLSIIVSIVVSIRSSIKSKQYKKAILNLNDFIEYYKFIIVFQSSRSEFIGISKLPNWNRGNKSQTYIDKILNSLTLLPRFYFHFDEKDKDKISNTINELQIDLCNLKQDDNVLLNKIRENLILINEITQSNLNKIQNKAYQKKL